jgi:serine/threonine protein kinase
LFRAGFRTETLLSLNQRAGNGSSNLTKGLPEPGEQFGHYRIIHTLGRGGMGVVLEAEDLENSRRLALKLLNQELDSPEARHQFLREGQIAASINHSQSVYVFGTEEIAGTPVIAMELMPGGTLRDRVASHGALSAAEAVDCILQIISGLEAAERAGILHRDIKPSNCFITGNGTVKIGDFGLSVGTQVRTAPERMLGHVMGTPAFSAPEQLRGEQLSVRSDIYAVGATLFYLLTAATPFAGSTVSKLLDNTKRVPEMSETTRLAIPAGLWRVVLRCLASQPARRYPNYLKLRQVLQRYASTFELPPARLSRRFLAALFDLSLLVPVCYQLSNFETRKDWVSTTVFYAMIFLYFGVTEGFWGASLGKALFRLRVVREGCRAPGALKALVRSVICLGMSLLVSDLIFNSIQSAPGRDGLFVALFLGSVFALLAGLFCSARRRNRFAAIHDLITNTRVVLSAGELRGRGEPLERSDESFRDLSQPLANRSFVTERARRVGPYELVGDSKAVPGTIILARDPALLRNVWVRVLPAGSPPVSVELRDLARPGRLRWLNGKRTATEAWDAYEAIAGVPVTRLCSKPQEWASVRGWLLDLAQELSASLHDGSVPQVLALDRVWITFDGRAILLDFPPPPPADNDSSGDTPQTAGETVVPAHPSVTSFLALVAARALKGMPCYFASQARAKPLPLHAAAFLHELREMAGAAAVAERLKPLLELPALFTRLDRLALAAACLWLPFILAVSARLLGESHPVPWMMGLGWLYGDLVVVLPALLAGAIFRGGPLLYGLGAVVVRPDGKPASRIRVLWRSILAWTPWLVLGGIASMLGLTYSNLQPDLKLLWVAAGCLATLGVFTGISILLPDRSLQDRLAGTYLVPR